MKAVATAVAAVAGLVVMVVTQDKTQHLMVSTDNVHYILEHHFL